jgi:hypothetical protein
MPSIQSQQLNRNRVRVPNRANVFPHLDSYSSRISELTNRVTFPTKIFFSFLEPWRHTINTQVVHHPHLDYPKKL